MEQKLPQIFAISLPRSAWRMSLRDGPLRAINALLAGSALGKGEKRNQTEDKYQET